METIVHDSELLTHHVAAVAVPDSRRFIAVRDENGLLMLFSIGTDDKIHISKITLSGQRLVLDFGLMLGLDDQYCAHAIDVVQDAASSTLYIAVATSMPAGSGSAVYILRPFTPREADLGSPSTRLTSFLMPETGSPAQPPRIFSIYMGVSRAGARFPPLLLAYQTEIHKSQDLVRVEVVDDQSGTAQWEWARKDDIALPENAAKIFAVQPVTFRLGSSKVLRGFVTLYEIQGDRVLLFRTFGEAHPYVCEITPCPSDARDIATLQGAEGYTDLVVGGAGLYAFKGTELAAPKMKLIATDGVFAAVKTLQVTQSPVGISIWAENTAQGIGYLETDLALAPLKLPVQVIPDGAGGYFCPLKATVSDPEKFISASPDGHLLLLEHDSVSGLWTATPLVTPALTKIIDVTAYMTQLMPLSAAGVPVLSSPVTLRASGEVSIIVNGRPVVATPGGVTVMTDQAGYVTLVIPTDDISSFTFTVSAVGSDPQLGVTVDPSSPVHERLSKALEQDLEDVTLPDGTRLMQDSPLDKEQIDAAADALKAALKQRQYLVAGVADANRPWEAPVGYRVDEICSTPPEGIKDMFWDGWHWLEHQADKVMSYVIDGAQFLVKIAGQTYRWVMKTLTQIAKAISWLIKKALELGKKLIQWLGFVFDWKDIKAAQQSIVNIANDGIDWAAGNVSKLRDKVDTFFAQMEHSLGQKERPSSSDVDAVNGMADDASASKDADKDISRRSVTANWTRYQFEHGGARDGAVVYYPGDPDGAWDAQLQGFHSQFEGQVVPLQTNLVDDYGPTGKRSLSTKSAFERILADFLAQVVGGVKGLTKSVLNGVETLFGKLKDFLNAKIDIPVFSALYKLVTGDDLSVLNVMALIIAIPATVIAKLVSNAALPTFQAGDYHSMMDQVVRGTVAEQGLLPFNKFANIAGLAAMGISTLFAVVSFGGLHSGGRPPSTSPSAPLAALAAAAAAAGNGNAFNWGVLIDTGLLFYHLFSVPSNEKLPAHVLRLASWLVSMLSSLVAFLLHLSAKFIGELKDKIRAVVDVVIEVITYALEITIRVKETQTIWEGKDDVWSMVDCAGHTFLLVGISGGALKTLSPEPITQKVGLAAQCIGLGGGIGILGVHGITSFAKEKFCDPPKYVGSA